MSDDFEQFVPIRRRGAERLSVRRDGHIAFSKAVVERITSTHAVLHYNRAQRQIGITLCDKRDAHAVPIKKVKSKTSEAFEIRAAQQFITKYGISLGKYLFLEQKDGMLIFGQIDNHDAD